MGTPGADKVIDRSTVPFYMISVRYGPSERLADRILVARALLQWTS